MLGIPALCSKAFTKSKSVRFFLSATPFDCSEYGGVNSWMIPCSEQKLEKSVEVYSPPLSSRDKVLSDMDKGSITPKMIALAARAAYEPIIVQHFGSQAAVVEEFGRTVECHVRAGNPQAG
jgi:hypothetical protein